MKHVQVKLFNNAFFFITDSSDSLPVPPSSLPRLPVQRTISRTSCLLHKFTMPHRGNNALVWFNVLLIGLFDAEHHLSDSLNLARLI